MKLPQTLKKIPWFENFERLGFRNISTIHELPYDHSILLDPSHVPISHDRKIPLREGKKQGHCTSRSQKELVEALLRVGVEKEIVQHHTTYQTFEAPCVLQSNRVVIDKSGEKLYFSRLFLCRPTGQGKSTFLLKLFPRWYLHQLASKILERDMGFLSSQNEILLKEKVPTRKLYINSRTSDVWVAEYRKWMDKVGHGMPYYFGRNSISLPQNPAVIEQAPAGFVVNFSASQPA